MKNQYTREGYAARLQVLCDLHEDVVAVEFDFNKTRDVSDAVILCSLHNAVDPGNGDCTKIVWRKCPYRACQNNLLWAR